MPNFELLQFPLTLIISVHIFGVSRGCSSHWIVAKPLSLWTGRPEQKDSGTPAADSVEALGRDSSLRCDKAWCLGQCQLRVANRLCRVYLQQARAWTHGSSYVVHQRGVDRMKITLGPL